MRAGNGGVQGPPGPGAVAYTAADYIQPANDGSSSVQTTLAPGTFEWVIGGSIVFVAGGGYYSVDDIEPDGTVSLVWIAAGASGTANPGSTIAAGTKVAPSGPPGPAGP